LGRPAGAAPFVAGAAFAGFLAFGALVVAHEGNSKFVFAAFVAVAFVTLLPLLGNVRLFSLYAIVLLAPMGLRLTFAAHPHMGGAGAIYIEPVDPFILLLLFFQVRDRVTGYRDTLRFPKALVIWTVMIGCGILYAIFQQMHVLAFLEVVRMLKLLLLALVVVNEVVRRHHFQHAVGALMVGAIIQSGFALTQYFLGHELGLEWLGEANEEDTRVLSSTSLEGGEFSFRAGGLLGHANLLAAYLALLLPVGIAVFLSKAPWLLKTLSILAIVLGAPALVLALSRAAWADFAVALALVLSLGALHPVSRRRFMLSRMAIIGGIAVLAIVLGPLMLKRLYDADPNSVKYRVKWMETGKAMILDNPVFGVGLNTYVYAQLPYGEQKTPGEMQDTYGDIWPVVHNSWLIIWAEQGTIGLAIWVAFHIAVLAAAIRSLKLKDPLMHALNVGLLSGFVAIMVDGMASFFVKQEATSRVFWITTALILAIDAWRQVNEPAASAAAAGAAARNAWLASQESREPRWLPARASPLR